jgi:hypothetical protein
LLFRNPLLGGVGVGSSRKGKRKKEKGKRRKEKGKSCFLGIPSREG